MYKHRCSVYCDVTTTSSRQNTCGPLWSFNFDLNNFEHLRQIKIRGLLIAWHAPPELSRCCYYHEILYYVCMNIIYGENERIACANNICNNYDGIPQCSHCHNIEDTNLWWHHRVIISAYLYDFRQVLPALSHNSTRSPMVPSPKTGRRCIVNTGAYPEFNFGRGW